MIFYEYIKTHPARIKEFHRPFTKTISEDVVKHARSSYEAYMKALGQTGDEGLHQSMVLEMWYVSIPDEMIARMFTINFFNMSYDEDIEVLDLILEQYDQMTSSLEPEQSLEFVQGPLVYPDPLRERVTPELRDKDAKLVTKFLERRLASMELVKGKKVFVYCRTYENVDYVIPLILIAPAKYEETELSAIAQAVQDEWVSYILFKRGKKYAHE